MEVFTFSECFLFDMFIIYVETDLVDASSLSLWMALYRVGSEYIDATTGLAFSFGGSTSGYWATGEPTGPRVYIDVTSVADGLKTSAEDVKRSFFCETFK